MSVLDEIRVGDDGQFDVRVIPPDSISLEPDLFGSYEVGSQAWWLIREKYLKPVRDELRLAGEISYIVHQGGDAFSVRTNKGEFTEIDSARNPRVLALLGELAHDVELMELSPVNERLRKSTG